MKIELEAIGVFHCAAKYPYDVPRQGACAAGNTGTIHLAPGHDYERAVQDLAGFSRVWLVFLFDRNEHWKPLVTPPRVERKIGVFATRAPYRPNPIGLSCVELLSVEGLKIEVANHDLLDGTPILDIKPYIPYADAFPEATTGWLDEARAARWGVAFGAEAEAALAWLEANSTLPLRDFLSQQLAERPTDTKRKRIHNLGEHEFEIAYRTWRAAYTLSPASQEIVVTGIYSGYTEADLVQEHDKYADKALHRAFQVRSTALRRS